MSTLPIADYSHRSSMNKFPGGHRGRVTPVPIPNTVVKPATADGTACAGVWESRSLPGLFFTLWAASAMVEAAFFFVPLCATLVLSR